MVDIIREKELYLSSAVQRRVRCPWGVWRMDTGAWEPNEKLCLSEEEQHRQNVENGFSCHHAYKPEMCPYCAGT